MAIISVVYAIYIFIRDAVSGAYPYPFIDVSKLGYANALVNTCFVFTAFFACSLLLVGIAKLMASRKAVSRIDDRNSL